jgi:L-asparaginase
MTRVVVLGTGGTIGSRFSDEHGAVIAGVGGDELLRNLGHFASTVDVVTEQFCNLGSFLFTLELAFGIAKRADQLLRDSGVAGVVATCGTDTMEEIAYLSDLIVISDKPIVFTGAQRHSGLPDSDGPRDLHNAILVAASNVAKGLGAVIVFEDEIHAARDTTKMHTSRVGAFASAEHGKLGEIDDGAVIVSRRTIRQHSIPAAAIETRVVLVKAYMGADGRFIDYAVETGSRGLVVEAFGRGQRHRARDRSRWPGHQAWHFGRGRIARSPGPGRAHLHRWRRRPRSHESGRHVRWRPQRRENQGAPGRPSRGWIVAGRDSSRRGVARTVGCDGSPWAASSLSFP